MYLFALCLRVICCTHMPCNCVQLKLLPRMYSKKFNETGELYTCIYFIVLKFILEITCLFARKATIDRARQLIV